TNPSQVPGEHLTKDGAPARVAVPELGGRRVPADLALGPGPVAAREARQIGYTCTEVGDQSGRCGLRAVDGSLWRAAPTGGHPGRGAGPRTQIALGLKLAVALLHQPARHTQLAGQFPGRRQPLADPQPAGPD